MNKIILVIGLILIAGIVSAYAVGTIFTAQQFVNVNLNTYDFELQQTGFRTNATSYIWDINGVSAVPVLNDNGDWNGSIRIIEIQGSYYYAKEFYKECRQTNTANVCKANVIASVKERILADIQDERNYLKKLQQDASAIINGTYDNEWGAGSLGNLK